MNFFPAKIRVVFFGLMIFYLAATAQSVRANISDYKQDDTKLLCLTKSIVSRCRFENESTVMIDLKGEPHGVRVVNNETWCQASVLLNISQERKAKESSTRTQCKTTLFNSSLGLNQSEENQKNRKRGEGETILGLKVIFEDYQTEGVFITVIRNKDRSFNVYSCLALEKFRPMLKQGCLRINSPYTEEGPADKLGTNSTSHRKETERNQRKTENYSLETYCLVVSCLFLEILVFAVLHLCVRNKCCDTRSEACETENTKAIVANPIYQPGLQHPQTFERLPISAQEPYQPLVVDSRGPGTSVEYRGLQPGLRDDRIGVPVDRTDYQDLDDTNQAEKYQHLVAQGALEDRECRTDYDEPEAGRVFKGTDANPSRVQHNDSAGKQESAGFLHSLRSVAQAVISLGRGTSSLTSSKPRPNQSTNVHVSLYDASKDRVVKTERGPAVLTENNKGNPKGPEDQNSRVTEELHAGEEKSAHDSKCAEEPLYYVLEGPTPEGNEDPMYKVLKELRALNASGPERVPSSDSLADPLYYDLENPDDAEDKNVQTKM